MTFSRVAAPSTTLRVVLLPRFAWEDEPAAPVGGFDPPMPRSGGGVGPFDGRWWEQRPPNP
jgi:hypothetical protein